jgi:hypothetical protein
VYAFIRQHGDLTQGFRAASAADVGPEIPVVKQPYPEPPTLLTAKQRKQLPAEEQGAPAPGGCSWGARCRAWSSRPGPWPAALAALAVAREQEDGISEISVSMSIWDVEMQPGYKAKIVRARRGPCGAGLAAS